MTAKFPKMNASFTWMTSRYKRTKSQKNPQETIKKLSKNTKNLEKSRKTFLKLVKNLLDSAKLRKMTVRFDYMTARFH
jgi:hypothetical protein